MFIEDKIALPDCPNTAAAPEIFDWQIESDCLALQIIRFDPTQFNENAFAAAGILRPPQIARSIRKRQAEYFYGRLAARSALHHANFPIVDIRTGQQREPIWPPGVIGSISHNKHCAVAVVLPSTLHGGIGIDIESAATEDDQASIIATALDTSELNVLVDNCGTLDKAAALTVVFSAKESFYKAVHAVVGRIFGFEAIRLTRFDCVGRRLEFMVAESLGGVWQPGRIATAHFRLLAQDDILTAVVW